MAPHDARLQAWSQLSRDFDVTKIDAVTQVLGLEDAISTGHKVLDGEIRGREVIDVNR